MYLGAHISISKGLIAAVQDAIDIGANTFQFFTRNPRGGQSKKLDPQGIEQAHNLLKEHNFGPLVGHTPYTYNLASAKPQVIELSLRTLKDDLERAELMGLPYLVLHTGSHGGQGVEKGLELVIKGLTSLLPSIPEGVMILLEGMAGTGTELGYSLAHLGEIIKACDSHHGLGVCLDTCHLTGAGYDLTKLPELFEEIEAEIGLERLKVFHLNDSKFPVGSKKDRHAKLGEGYIGLETLVKVVCAEELKDCVFILETPNELDGYAEEIKLVRKLCSK